MLPSVRCRRLNTLLPFVRAAAWPSVRRFDTLLEKCKEIVSYFSHSHVKVEDLKKAQAAFKQVEYDIVSPHTALRLISECQTRWSSRYNMIKRLKQISGALAEVVALDAAAAVAAAVFALVYASDIT